MVAVVHYFDYKSPYAYLAQEDTYKLAAEENVELEWRPYTLDIPSYLGAAELDANGQDTIGTRNAHQWRRVKYAYMDCRREAHRRGLVIRGPHKIWDSALAHIGFLFAQNQGVARDYHDRVFELFWRRELDLEDIGALTEILAMAGVNTDQFADYARGEGRRQHDAMRAIAETSGVFGVPSYVVDGELYWGYERLPRVREHIARQAAQADRA